VLSPPERENETEDIFRRLKAGETAIHYETSLLKKGGSPMLAAVAASVVYNRAGEIRGTSAIMRDITGQRAAEERLKNLQAELIHLSRWNTMGMMASTLAHELNQPLTAAVNYVRAARRLMDAGPLEVGRVSEFLDRAVGETKLAGGIIRSLREFIDKRESQRTPEDINTIVEEAISLNAGAPDIHTVIETRLGSSLPPVVVDKIQIEQVLLNLMRNGLDAMGDQQKKNLTVLTAKGAPGYLLVSVADSGPGVAPKIAASCSSPSSPPRKTAWAWASPSASPSSKPMVAASGRRKNKPTGTVFHFQLPVEDGGGHD